MAKDGEPEAKRQKVDVYALAKVVSQKIREEFAGRSLDLLASPTTWIKLTRPDLRGITSFNYMGRECTRTIVDFLLGEPDAEAPLIIDDGEGMMFVVGTPGFGKTTSLNAAFGYLHHKFSNESPATSRILYLKGKSFVVKPGPSLFRAILLAFADEDLQLDQNDYTGLITFLEGREEKLYLLFNDGNAMDPDMKEEQPSKLPKATPAMRDAARGNLHELAEICKTLVCASVTSYITDTLKTDKGGPFKKFVGGFSDDERAAYLGHVQKQMSDEDFERTGSVPRLLGQFFFRPDKLRVTLSWYEEGIREYIDRAVHDSQKRWEAFQMISGTLATWDELPDVMKSRCFFQGRDQRVECLTTHLKSYALSYFASRLRCQSLSSASEEIAKWVSMVQWDTNIVRIGWTAEAATIAAFSLLRDLEVDCSSFMEAVPDPALQLNQAESSNLFRCVHQHVSTLSRQAALQVFRAKLEEDLSHRIREKELKFRAEDVVHFEGKLQWSMLKTGKPTLFIPKAFNHYGADIYFADPDKVVIIQISCSRNGKETHPNTRLLMESCPAEEKRRRLILWVLPAVPWEHETTAKGYEEIQISFGKLHPQLECIDDRCVLLRGIETTDCVYCGNLDAQVRCSSCFYWSHEECARKDMQLQAEDSFSLESFECLHCRTKGKKRPIFT